MAKADHFQLWNCMPFKKLLKSLSPNHHNDKHSHQSTTTTTNMHHNQKRGNEMSGPYAANTAVTQKMESTHTAMKKDEGLPLYKQHMSTVVYTPVQTTDEAAASEMQRLNSILQDYKQQMANLENTNRRLTEEFNRVRQPLVSEVHTMKITDKTVPLPPMDSKLYGQYAQSVADTEDLKARLNRSERERQEQMRRAQALQQKMMQKEAEKENMDKEKDEAERKKKNIEMQLDALQEKMRRERGAVEMERLQRRYAQLKVSQLEHIVAAYDTSMKELKKEVKDVTQVQASTVMQAELKSNMESIRRDYEMSRTVLSRELEQRANKFYEMWQSETRAVEELKKELEMLKPKVAALTNLQNENAGLRNRLEQVKRDLLAAEQKRDMLQKQHETTQRHIHELKKVVDDERYHMGTDAKLYGAVADYRNIVENELLPNQQGVQPKGVVTTTHVHQEKMVQGHTGRM